MLILSSGIYLFVSPNESKESSNVPTVVVPDQENNQAESAPPTSSNPGVYLDYSEKELANRSDTTRLLSFHAPWCPQCRALDEDIKSNTVPTGVTIFKVDYDSNQDLRKKYGVTIQTTIVRIDQNGNLVEKYIAYDEPTLSSVSANLL